MNKKIPQWKLHDTGPTRFSSQNKSLGNSAWNTNDLAFETPIPMPKETVLEWRGDHRDVLRLHWGPFQQQCWATQKTPWPQSLGEAGDCFKLCPSWLQTRVCAVLPATFSDISENYPLAQPSSWWTAENLVWPGQPFNSCEQMSSAHMDCPLLNRKNNAIFLRAFSQVWQRTLSFLLQQHLGAR